MRFVGLNVRGSVPKAHVTEFDIIARHILQPHEEVPSASLAPIRMSMSWSSLHEVELGPPIERQRLLSEGSTRELRVP